MILNQFAANFVLLKDQYCYGDVIWQADAFCSSPKPNLIAKRAVLYNAYLYVSALKIKLFIIVDTISFSASH